MSRFRTKAKARVGIAVIASLALALSACGGSSDSADTAAAESPAAAEETAEETVSPEATFEVAFSAPSLADSGSQVIASSFRKYVEDRGWGFKEASADGDPSKQLSDVMDFINRGVSAIVIQPVDAKAVCAAVDAARSANIPIYAIARSTTGCEVDMTVVSDNEQAGQLAGEAMVELLTEKFGAPRGTVLELQGDLGDNGAIARGKGFNDVIVQYPDIKVIQKPTEWQSEKFASVTRDVVSAEDVDGIYMHSDSVGAIPVQSALEQMGKLSKRGEANHMILVGVDGSIDMLKCISEGYCDATANQPLTDFGIVTHWMNEQFSGRSITTEPYSVPDTIWSPATPVETSTGWFVNMLTSIVDDANVSDPRLWANQIPKQ